MRAALGHLATVIATVLVSSAAVHRLCVFHAAYQLQRERIEREAWLRDQCASPEFFAHMRHHTDVCDRVEATARIGAAWHALQATCVVVPAEDLAVLVQRLSWPVLAALACLCILCPSLLVAHARGRATGLPISRPDWDPKRV
jgi:hypothetical protein